jgi:hypothetical protein
MLLTRNSVRGKKDRPDAISNPEGVRATVAAINKDLRLKPQAAEVS